MRQTIRNAIEIKRALRQFRVNGWISEGEAYRNGLQNLIRVFRFGDLVLFPPPATQRFV